MIPTRDGIHSASMSLANAARYAAMALGHDGWAGKKDEAIKSHWADETIKELTRAAEQLGFELTPRLEGKDARES